MPGSGQLTVTGQLGDVMKESAQAAFSYVRAHSRELGVDDDYFEKHDLHIHVPAGAMPKDGPCAGVTMATAICSLVTGRPSTSDVAMTGEITLTGQVLPIGGLKEKTLAAQRAGINTVILPTRNEADLEDMPEHLREDMTFVPADRVEQVWKAAMGLEIDGGQDPRLRRGPGAGRKTPATCCRRRASRRPTTDARPAMPRTPARRRRRPRRSPLRGRTARAKPKA